MTLASEMATTTAGRSRELAVAVVGVLVVAGLVAASVLLGAQTLAPAQVWHALASPTGTEADLIVTGVRLPRTLVAVSVGAALAVSGVLLQAVVRNPLAEPGLLGVSAGAGFAVAAGYVLLGLTSYRDTLWLSLVGTVVGVVAVLGLTRAGGGRAGAGVGDGPVRLVLAGVAVAAVLSAATSAVSMLSPRGFAQLARWSAGTFAGRELPVALTTLVAVGLGVVLALALAPGLRLLALGDDTARGLGTRVGLVRGLALLAVVVLCGAATAAAGPVAFVGLVVPQVLRLLLGHDPGRLLRGSLLAGPALVLVADLVARTVIAPAEVSVGVVTAFVGAPVLIALALGHPRRLR
ncbi:iron complex transport system permease protein [Quadrisphaera granulorum]|uniref:Iron complex transport system permease protein n=1 Tax=Quadrisphaera granulorum TaxID=317664 RepID=A0A316A829_9ACTN|nr:iron ABC transporter permease [Quadrisphaera granulorum]PWJ53642.1 iron complex transport system permease protein [Quadrisphaera granulorum]SZE96686.1 iron complex transport system permease protein [Quadrisphaera granulorum]